MSFDEASLNGISVPGPNSPTLYTPLKDSGAIFCRRLNGLANDAQMPVLSSGIWRAEADLATGRVGRLHQRFNCVENRFELCVVFVFYLFETLGQFAV